MGAGCRVARHERNGVVDASGDVQVELGPEEAHAGLGDACGRLAACPLGIVESGEMPALALSVEAAFVQNATYFVWEASAKIITDDARPCTCAATYPV